MLEVANFGIWIAAIATLVGIGLGAMIWAYVGRGRVRIVFAEPIALPPESDRPDTLTPEQQKAIDYFQQGTDYFRSAKFDAAMEAFDQAIELAPDFAQAYHNRGLVLANLQKDNEAVRYWLKAGELYAEQNAGEGVENIRQALNKLKQR